MQTQAIQHAATARFGGFPAPQPGRCCEACGAGFLAPVGLTYQGNAIAGPGYYCDRCLAGMRVAHLGRGRSRGRHAR